MKIVARFCVLTLLGLAFVTASAQAAYQEGVDYERIVPAQPTAAAKGKVEVVELFWYGCPHCFRFEPYIERWLPTVKDKVDFIRLPAVLRPSWAIHARAFYAAKALGVFDKIHRPLFDAIHVEKRNLDDEDSLAAFFVEHGVDKDAFLKAFNSFSVDSEVKRAMQMTRRYHAMGTPAMVVDGKYLTDPGMANGFVNILKVVDSLVDDELKKAK